MGKSYGHYHSIVERALRQHPGSSVAELATLTKLSTHCVRDHLESMVGMHTATSQMARHRYGYVNRYTSTRERLPAPAQDVVNDRGQPPRERNKMDTPAMTIRPEHVQAYLVTTAENESLVVRFWNYRDHAWGPWLCRRCPIGSYECVHARYARQEVWDEVPRRWWAHD